MAHDATEAWNALEILLAECNRRLDYDNWQEHFSPRLLERVETLANRARINSPARFHQSPFNSERVVSLWCPWTIECMFVGTQAQFSFATIRTTLEKWISWRHFYNAGGELDLQIQNKNLWPPSGADWDKRTEIRESDCQALLDARDRKGLSSLFSESPRAFIFALDSWVKQLVSVFEANPETFHQTHKLRNEVPETALVEVFEVLCLIREAQANVERKSDVAKFDCENLSWFEQELGRMLRNHARQLHISGMQTSFKYPFIDSDCRYFERTLMQRWLTDLAHSTDCSPSAQIPTPIETLASQLDIDARKLGKVPYWDDANSTLWLNGNQRRYLGQMAQPSREIFKSLENAGWSTAAPCSISAKQARQCCKDRSADNQLGIKFTYSADSKTVKATWKTTAYQVSPNRPEAPEKSPETPEKSPETP